MTSKNALVLFFFSFYLSAQVGINTLSPNTSSALEIFSKNKGLLIPRMSEIQRSNINLPADGLLIYQNDNDKGFYFFDGAIWKKIITVADHYQMEDINGNKYKTIEIGDDVWTQENAKMQTYNDGTPIPYIKDPDEWKNLTTGAYTHYQNNEAKERFYNWYAIIGKHDNDPNTPNKNLAPSGWHVATENDWENLEQFLINNGFNYDLQIGGNKIAKSLSSVRGWDISETLGAVGNDQDLNNSSGFNAFPYGFCSLSGDFSGEGGMALFWSLSKNGSLNSPPRTISYNDVDLTTMWYYVENIGLSVRFVKD